MKEVSMVAQAQRANREEISEAVRHAAAKLSQDLARTAQDAQDAAAEFATAVGHSAQDFGGQAMTQARGATRTIQENMRAHPIAWGSAALGAGALIGLLLSRRTQ
jgi:ElaB/YqjD/DUF883 family membrane-anchored ribosome-binding protein